MWREQGLTWTHSKRTVVVQLQEWRKSMADRHSAAIDPFLPPADWNRADLCLKSPTEQVEAALLSPPPASDSSDEFQPDCRQSACEVVAV